MRTCNSLIQLPVSVMLCIIKSMRRCIYSTCHTQRTATTSDNVHCRVVVRVGRITRSIIHSCAGGHFCLITYDGGISGIACMFCPSGPRSEEHTSELQSPKELVC